MALKQREIIDGAFTLPVGATALLKGDVCQLSSSALIVGTANTEAGSVFITLEPGAANGHVRCALPGQIVLVRCADANVDEGEYVVCTTAGEVTQIANLTTASQYAIGVAQQASSAEDQYVSVMYWPQVCPKDNTGV